MRRRLQWLPLVILLLSGVAIALLCAGIIGMLLRSPVRDDEQNLRERPEAEGGIQQLQVWAIQQMENKTREDTLDHLPRELRALGVQSALALPSASREIEYIQFEFGGGFRHYGLVIGRKDSPPAHSVEVWSYVNQWDNRTWYYDELKAR
jgi:hypothetical protein